MFTLVLVSLAFALPPVIEGRRVRIGLPQSPEPDRETMRKYEVIVVGGGPAGVEAAVEAASFSDAVALVEPQQIFGVPSGAFSKALRTTALIAETKGNFTFKTIEEQIQGIFSEAEISVRARLKKAGVHVIKGKGELVDSQTLLVKNPSGAVYYGTDTFFLATGSKAWLPPKPSINGKISNFVFDSDTINRLTKIPQNIVISGGGIVSLEFAMFFRKLGAQVTLVARSDIKVKMTESLDMDSDLTDALKNTLEKDGVTVLRQTNMLDIRLNEAEDGVVVTLKSKLKEGNEEIPCDAVLFAVGRKGNTVGLGLEQIGVDPDKITVDEESFLLKSPRVYAIGDLVDGKFASVAKQQAHIAVQHWVRTHKKRPAAWRLKKLWKSWFRGDADKSQREVRNVAPVSIWSLPELSGVGETESSLQEKGVKYGIAKAYYTDIVRGVLEGASRAEQTGQFLKILYAETGYSLHQIVGVHIFGEMANDLVLFGQECITQKKTLEDIAEMSFPAVTYHELYSAAARNVLLEDWEESSKGDCKVVKGGKDREEDHSGVTCKCKKGYVLGEGCPQGRDFKPGERYYSKRTMSKFHPDELKKCQCEMGKQP